MNLEGNSSIEDKFMLKYKYVWEETAGRKWAEEGIMDFCVFSSLMIRGAMKEGGREGVDGFKQIKFPLIKQIFQLWMEGGLVHMR
jgi:hypothetical protein